MRGHFEQPLITHVQHFMNAPHFDHASFDERDVRGAQPDERRMMSRVDAAHHAVIEERDLHFVGDVDGFAGFTCAALGH